MVPQPDPEPRAGPQASARLTGVQPDDGLPIVGIGASAGGLDAFTRLLQHLPADTGFAFVLVQHLDASHPSSLSEILGRATSMPVADATDGAAVEPNRVYVIPANTELTVVDRTLRLGPRSASAAPRPIDRFLQSLARDCGSRAVGVILSGNGADGSDGLMAIRAAGGMTFAQDPSSAEFPSMPSMAAAAGADVILPAEDIALELARYVDHPHFATSADAAAAPPASSPDAARLAAICAVMRDATGIDFSLYRESMVYRRILRRLAVRRVDLEDYAALLANEPGERAALQQDLLIGVTSFFRDPDSFDALKRVVFPAIVQARAAHPHAPIRIWVPGCATGEEAYSILISLQEFQRDAETALPIQLFASDVSETAIETARRGRYAAGIADDLSPERLQANFTRVDGGYQITKALRERCVFSRHNLIEDPPFSHLDLISCRNVLIYLDSVQRKILPLFHYALADPGFLMLGRSETTHHADLFAAAEPRHRIYAKRRVARRPYESFARPRAARPGSDVRAAATLSTLAGRRQADLSREADRIVLSSYGPPAVLIDDALQVLEIRGDSLPFVALGPGRASLHLLTLLPDTGLFLAIERLVHEAMRSDEPARQADVRYEVAGRTDTTNVEVRPVHSGDRRAFLVLFDDVSAAPGPGLVDPHPPRSVGPQAGSDQRIEKLTRELRDARARIVSLIEEHEASDEESQHTTEEALSANEELQSLTEELETAKEELQSTNEELLTVNRELEARNIALASAHDLAKSIVENVAVPLVVVDRELVVRHVNAAFERAFGAAPTRSDGRPLAEVSGGAWDFAELRSRLDQLLATRTAFENVEVERVVPAVGRRVLVLSGRLISDLGLILLTIEDVTARRDAERALQRSEEQRRQGEKMEVIGRLAGGIAHDFNNLLTVIIGNADFVAEASGLDDATIDQLAAIRRASEKAAVLTDQLLAFSRRKVLRPQVFDLAPLIVDIERMLGRVLGEQIVIAVRPATMPCLVRADPTEIERVVMNLCVNARDAMPAGGVLTIETGRVTLDDAAAAAAGLPAGPYVQLVVADTGRGMTPETRQHAFEPFFTSKDASTGAGLGLATVFGIVQQSGGSVSCESEIGRGTRFTILLPLATSAQPDPVGDRSLAVAPKGSETVLVVEDDDGVRALTRLILERSGYTVLDASDGRQALEVLRARAGRVHLVVSDVLMPGMGGGVLAQQAMALYPALKVMFVSGHPENTIVREGVSKGMAFLRKPYTPTELAYHVRAALDAGPRPPNPAAGPAPNAAGGS
jgi:two-component system CheB/CheR fusion protein